VAYISSFLKQAFKRAMTKSENEWSGYMGEGGYVPSDRIRERMGQKLPRDGTFTRAVIDGAVCTK